MAYMIRIRLQLFWAISFFFMLCYNNCHAQQKSAQDYLVMGNSALSEDANAKAIDLYEEGLAAIDSSVSLVTIVSLETNLATAYSSMEGMQEHVFEHYEKAIKAYQEHDTNDISETDHEDAKSIVSQTAFFYGMELQESNARKATEMYGNAVRLDPELWAAWANLGSVFHDQLNNHDEALLAYNQAYEILTEHDEPTDPPAEPRYILSQLQYRMGLCLSHDPNRKCTYNDKQVSCQEMAAHAFSQAVEYDAGNEYAKHMLASLTADATMKKASNEYVKNLFDDYAQNFESSLVKDLGYDGYERLRRAFDRGMKTVGVDTSGTGTGTSTGTTFDVVLDAGCGTGLVGEQFRNVSSHLIGVDLSEAILDEAEKLRPKLYDERIVGDVAEVIRDRQPIDLIVAADSFIYFGDLDPLFASIGDGLGTSAYIAFTLENVSNEDETILAESKPDWRWQLTASGRFAHRKEYIASIGRQHGLKVIHYEPLEGFRHELGKDVRGHAFLMQKDAVNDEL